ncbi:hypothetical protein [Microcoleus sp. herbarium8]|uniref:hypothetical protein n=1 Tax=Microcoleus sp. herbarium8 TaxID=3055436 RepID=UPI002FD2A0BA
MIVLWDGCRARRRVFSKHVLPEAGIRGVYSNGHSAIGHFRVPKSLLLLPLPAACCLLLYFINLEYAVFLGFRASVYTAFSCKLLSSKEAEPPDLRYQAEPGNEQTVNSQQSTVNSQQSTIPV